jgi:hypothetical protein
VLPASQGQEQKPESKQENKAPEDSYRPEKHEK